MFSEEQNLRLGGKLLKTQVSKRKGSGGMELDYIESWWAIEEANNVFGFDGWQTSIVDTQVVWSGERDTRNGPKPAVSVMATVRLQVDAGGKPVVREDVGYGDAMDNDLGKAHELAMKEAVSDAQKRCLRTFGNKFGNGLYAKGPEREERLFDPAGKSFDECKDAGVRMTSSAAKADGVGDKIKYLIGEAASVSDLDERWEVIKTEYWATLPRVWLQSITDTYENKREALQAQEA